MPGVVLLRKEEVKKTLVLLHVGEDDAIVADFDFGFFTLLPLLFRNQGIKPYLPRLNADPMYIQLVKY